MAGVDGARWTDLHRLIDGGRLPCFARLVDTGTSGILESAGLSGAMLWASLATGAPPSAHGIAGAFEIRPDRGGVQPLTARSWKTPPIWQMLAELGVPTAIIGCPATVPATHWRGLAVDERFAQPLGSEVEDWPLPPHCVSPSSLREKLRELRLHPGEMDAATRGALPPEALAAVATVHAAATYVAEHENWRFLAVYYGLMAQSQSEEAYVFQDAMLARLLELAGDGTDIIIVSEAGVLIAAGPGFARDALVHGVGPYDIAATVLARFGFRAEGGAGHVLPKTRHAPLRNIAQPQIAPAPVAQTAPPPSPAAATLIAGIEYETLFRQATAAVAVGDHRTAAPLLEAALENRPGDHNARFLLGQCRFFLGEWEACLHIGRALTEALPQSPWGEMMTGAALALSGDTASAEPHLTAASSLAGNDSIAQIRLGAIALHLGKAQSAEQHYAQALALDPVSADARAGLGLARLAQDDAEGAEANLRASLGLRYTAPALHHQLGLLYASQERWREARAALRIALAQHPNLTGAADLLHEVVRQLLRNSERKRNQSR